MAKRKALPANSAQVEAATQKAVAEPKVVEVDVLFDENDDDETITARFPTMNDSKPFTITLQNMTWELVEDIEKLQQAGSKGQVGLGSFFNKYVVGGVQKVPIKHTLLVFEALTQYIGHAVGSVDTKN